ncbi:MAG: hypothetical protein LBQ93_10585 [Treponema sp.]|jgi:hypothetical protein|nr:hypothetical protein [Treponema sp.]
MKKIHQLIILIAIYALALGIRVYWLSQKEGLHVDEGMTIAIACYNDFILRENYEYGKKYTGKELKEASLVSDVSLKDALSDVRNLWKDNRDAPHTNLYYSFLRLSLVGLKTGDVAPIVFRGGFLNLLFFTVSFIFFFLLMRLLFAGSKLLQYAAVFCAFISTAAISNTLFIRPYQIQETLFIMFCYYFVLSLRWNKHFIHEKKFNFGLVKPLLLVSLLTAVTLLTGYYAIIFIGLFGLYAIYLLCANKKFTEIPFYFAVLGLGVLFAQILYPKYLSGFSSYRGKETIRTISANMQENIRSSMTSAGTLLQKHFFTIPVIIVCVLCLAYIVFIFIRGKKTLTERSVRAEPAVQKTAWYIFAASVIFLFIVLIIAPYKVLRYGMPVFPFLAILPAMLISSVETQSRKIAFCAMLLLCGCFALNAAKESKIENIFRGKPDEYAFAQDKDTPVYVINGAWSSWKYGNLIPYVNDEQTYYFIDWFKYFDDFFRTGEKSAVIQLPYAEDYDSFYVVIEYIPQFPQLESLIMEDVQAGHVVESEFEINTGEPETWYPYFKGRKMFRDYR